MHFRARALWSVASLTLLACGSRTNLDGSLYIAEDASGGTQNSGGTQGGGADGNGGSSVGGVLNTGGILNTGGAGGVFSGDGGSANTGGAGNAPSTGGTFSGGGGTGGIATGGVGTGGVSTGGQATGGTGGAPPTCIDGSTQVCYSGTDATKGVGICHTGLSTCQNGAFGPCLGEQLPDNADDCATPADEDCNGLTPACPWTPPFSVSFGDQESQVGLGVATAADGGAWVTGYFWGGLDSGAPAPLSVDQSDLFLRKVSVSGSITKTEAFGGAGRQEPSGILVAPNGDVIVGGYFNGTLDLSTQVLTGAGSFDGFVARFDENGVAKSAFRYGDNSNQYVRDIAFAKNGNVLALGYYGVIGGFSIGGTPITSQGGADWLVARLDDNSAVVDVHTYGNSGTDNSSALAVAPDGTAWVLGTFNKAVSYGCAELHAFGKADVFVVGLNEQGQCVKSTSIGSPEDDAAGDIAVDSMGNLVVTGSVYAPFEIATQLGTKLTQTQGYFVVGLTPELTPRFVHVMPNNGWTSGFPVPYGPAIPRLAMDASDHVLMAGGFAGLMTIGAFTVGSAGDADLFYLKLASNGTAIGGLICGDGQRQVAYGLSAGPVLNYVTGAFSGALTDCVSAKVSDGAEDVFVLGVEP